MIYDDAKYTQALKDLSEQIAAQIIDDGAIGYDAADFEVAIDDSVAVAMSDLTSMIDKLV